MSLVINNNMMAQNTARNLTETYGRLATSVQRLSTGMRINSAADDAAGLAIRETMRAEVAAMNQGIRNAQDGISMIQTAEGALAVIDEKLIRMKELAEQAATGTYTEAQRMIIHSEFSAMASEIDRIAESTEFNGIKLLNGNTGAAGFQGLWTESNTWVANGQDGVAGSGLWANHSGWEETNGAADAEGNIHGGIKVHFGTTNDRAEDYYFVRIADARTESLFSAAGEGPEGPSDVIHLRGEEGAQYLADLLAGDEYDTIQLSKDALFSTEDDDNPNITNHAGGWLAAGSTLAVDSEIALTHGQEIVLDGVSYTYLERGFNEDGDKYSESASLTSDFYFGGLVKTDAYKDGSFYDHETGEIVAANVLASGDGDTILSVPTGTGSPTLTFTFNEKDTSTDPVTPASATITVTDAAWVIENDMQFSVDDTIEDGSIFKTGSVLNLTATDEEEVDQNLTLNEDCDGIEIVSPELAKNSLEPGAVAPGGSFLRGSLPSLRTQHQAQDALEHIDTAILRKENIRASLGAIQNRLENTITNLSIQAENLQAAESRISDVDIASEMTEFIRNQVLTQASVAMLGQANTLPQLALRLLG